MTKSKMPRKLFENQGWAKNPRKLTVHCGTSVQNPNLEESLYGWITESRFAKYCFEDSINYEIELETESDSDWLLWYSMY